MCPDIPCLKACPTGALSPGLKKIEDARMGLAVIDIENCLSWKGLRCEICHRDCPLKGKAIVRAIGSTPDDPYSLIYLALVSAIVNAEFDRNDGRSISGAAMIASS